MRLSTTLTAGVPAAAALVLLTACGSGSAGSPAAGGSAAASSGAAQPSSSGAEVEAFCSEAEKVFTDLNTAFDSASAPTELPPLLQQATSALQTIDPPAEITSSWTSFSEALAQLSQAAQGLDLGTPDGQNQFTQQYTALMTDTQGAQNDVDQFVTAHCPGAASSSPSS
jgi:hypothetical protein